MDIVCKRLAAACQESDKRCMMQTRREAPLGHQSGTPQNDTLAQQQQQHHRDSAGWLQHDHQLHHTVKLIAVAISRLKQVSGTSSSEQTRNPGHRCVPSPGAAIKTRIRCSYT